MNAKTFSELAGEDKRLSELEMTKAIEAVTPASRMRLNPKIRSHAELLSTSFDMIEHNHIETVNKLAEWIAARWKPSDSVHVITTCTGNSRRSILCSTMGNVAAAYYGFENVHFHSGGTVPSAFNTRTIATLKDIGFEIESTGHEATRGENKVPNPVYRVVWGQGLECLEFSKSYKDKSNPQSDFAVILVCAEADAECVTVPEASLRLSMTLIDPKLYDDSSLESKKYAERRDDVGRTLMAVMLNARRRIEEKNGKVEFNF
jgi:arsenate reductase (thioredoxin)